MIEMDENLCYNKSNSYGAVSPVIQKERYL